MGILSGIGKLVKAVGKKLTTPTIGKSLATGKPTVAPIDVLPVGKIGKAGKGVIGAVKSLLSKPAVKTTGKTLGKAVTALGSAIAKKGPVGTAKAVVGTAAVTGVAVGGGVPLVKAVFKGSKKASETAVDVLSGEKKLSKETVGDVLKTGGIIAGVGAVAGGAAYLLDKALGTDEQQPSSPVSQSSITPNSNLGASQVPITPETQVIGKAASSGTTRRKRNARKPQIQRSSQSVRVVNVINSRLQNARLINNRAITRRL